MRLRVNDVLADGFFEVRQRGVAAALLATRQRAVDVCVGAVG